MRQVVRILQVEDSPEDRMLLAEAFGTTLDSVELHSAVTSKEAIAVLCSENQWRPDVVLLDISLPGDTGFTVLNFIKNQKDLRHLAVIVFSTSTAESDIAKAYNLHANSYIPKPADFDGYVALVTALKEFYLRWVRLPSTKWLRIDQPADPAPC
jgi:chemotaxis family two-component system response regulator Rcp1